MHTHRWLLMLGLCGILSAAASAGNVQKCVAADGSVTFTDTSCPPLGATQDNAAPSETPKDKSQGPVETRTSEALAKLLR